MKEPRITKRRLQAEETKQRIFHAAHALLAESDFENITIKDIVDRAGVSVGTFYLYFPSKLEVYYDTYRYADQFFAEAFSHIEEDTTQQRLLRFFDCYADYNAKRTGLKLTKLLYNAENKYFLRDEGSGMFQALRRILQEGLACGDIDTRYTADYLLDFFMTAARGLTYNWCLHEGAYDLNAAMERYVSTLLQGVLRCAPQGI